MDKPKTKPNVVVIGGGMAGLTAAILLARHGKSVLLLERSQALGGRAQTSLHDGFYFNRGPHALYRGGAGFRILNQLGVRPIGSTPSSSGRFAINNGKKHAFPAGFFSLLMTDLLNLAGKLEAARLLTSLPRLNCDQYVGVTVQEWVNANISQPDVRSLLLALFRVSTYSNTPDLMDAGAALEQLQLALRQNVLYLDNGWQSLVDRLSHLAEQEGVSIKVGVPAELIERNGSGAVKAVHLVNGESIPATTVVVATNPSDTVNLIERGATSSLQQSVQSAIPVQAACLDLALSRWPAPNVSFALGIDAPLYLSVHSAVAHLAPAGGALIHAAMYLSPNESRSAATIEKELEDSLDLVQPSWRSLVVHRQFLPRINVCNAIPSASQNGVKGRPGPLVEDIPGLYIIGDWVGQEGLLVDASLSSAYQAAQLIAGRLDVRYAIAESAFVGK